MEKMITLRRLEKKKPVDFSNQEINYLYQKYELNDLRAHALPLEVIQNSWWKFDESIDLELSHSVPFS